MKSMNGRGRDSYALMLALAAALGTACASTDDVHCTVGADCASGICNADGTCEPVSTTTGEGGSSGTDTAGGGTGGSGGTGGDSGSGTGAGGSGVCSPDDDGTITREEMPLQAGLSAKFRVATNADFDTAGAPQGDGSRTWDFTVALSGDHSVIVETLSLDGAWYAAEFPGATYATRLSDSTDLLGVFEVADDGLYLRGVVSPDDSPTGTDLSYEPPVKVLAFPMQEGDTWTTDSVVSGKAAGIFGFYSETYESVVDAHGTAKTPFADFAVLRVATDLTRVTGALITTSRTFAFASECFGPVATIVSQTDELGAEFTSASELRRLTP